MNALWEIVQTRLVRRGVPIKNFKARRVEAGRRRHRAAGDHDPAGHSDRGRARDRQVPQGQETEEGPGGDPGRSGAGHVAVEGRAAGRDAARCATTTSASRCSSATTGSAATSSPSSLPIPPPVTFSGSIFRIAPTGDRSSDRAAPALRSRAPPSRPSAARDSSRLRRQQLLDFGLSAAGILRLDLQREQLRRLRLERFDDPQHHQDEDGREHRQHPHADARRQADGERGQHDAGVLRILNLRAVAHQPGGADDAERAREARADDEHHDRADDGEDDLRLDDRRLAMRRAAAARPQREHARQPGGNRQPVRRRVVELRRIWVRIRRRFGADSRSGGGRRPASS